MEELRASCDVPDNVDLKLMEEPDDSTMGGEHNALFFTWEHLAVGLHFPVSAIVKQFLHFTRAPLILIHPNTIQILTRCGELNFLYQLDLSLVEIYFAYFLRIAQGGRMSMSDQRSRLQFVNGLPDSPKMEAKVVLLVRGPWDVTQVILGSHLMLIGHNLSQVCVKGRLSLTMYVYTYDFLCIPDYGLLVQGKIGGVGWYIGWKRQALRKFAGCWRFSNRSVIMRFFLL